MKVDNPVSVTIKHSSRMKFWLYGLLLILMIAVSSLADINTLFLMLLFPIGVGFNWLFFRSVSLAAKSSIVGFEYQGNTITLIQKDGTRWPGQLVAIQWNSHWLTILKLAHDNGKKRSLVLFSDAADAEALRALRVWLTTSA